MGFTIRMYKLSSSRSSRKRLKEINPNHIRFISVSSVKN